MVKNNKSDRLMKRESVGNNGMSWGNLMSRGKFLICGMMLLAFWGFGNKARGQTSITLHTCNSMPHQVGNNINISFTVNGPFHHYHAYMRPLYDLDSTGHTVAYNATSPTCNYTWTSTYAAAMYRVVIVVYAYDWGSELVNTKYNSSYNLEIKSLSVTTNNASSITAYSAYLSGSATSGYYYNGIRYRMTTGSSTWTYTYNGNATITGLQPCKTYEFQYWAEYCNPSEIDGASKTFTTSIIPTPTGVSASKSGSSVNISWSSVQSGTVYRVYRSNSASGTYSQIGSTSGTNYTDNSPLCGDNYYKITVQADICESNQSSYVSVNYASPTAPTSISGTTTICSGNSTTLTASGGSIGDGCTYHGTVAVAVVAAY